MDAKDGACGDASLPCVGHFLRGSEHDVEEAFYRSGPEDGLEEFALAFPVVAFGVDEAIPEGIAKAVVDDGLLVEVSMRLVEDLLYESGVIDEVEVYDASVVEEIAELAE